MIGKYIDFNECMCGSILFMKYCNFFNIFSPLVEMHFLQYFKHFYWKKSQTNYIKKSEWIRTEKLQFGNQIPLLQTCDKSAKDIITINLEIPLKIIIWKKGCKQRCKNKKRLENVTSFRWSIKKWHRKKTPK